MMDKIATLFSDFDRQARLYPALLLLTPVLANVLLVWPGSPLVRIAPLLVGVGGLYVLTDLVRGRGQALEPRLIAKWDGLPTRRALRFHEGHNQTQHTRRRNDVERLMGTKLPSRQSQRANAKATDHAIDDAVRAIIPRVRGRENDELLHEANIRYNYRRNLLASRTLGLTVAVAAGTLDIALLLTGYRVEAAAVGLAVSGLCGLFLLLAVTEKWVAQASNTYADRFFEAVSQLREP